MQVRKACHILGITSSEMLASCVGAGRHLSSMYESGLKPAAVDPGGEMGAPAKTRAACSRLTMRMRVMEWVCSRISMPGTAVSCLLLHFIDSICFKLERL
jgi:hypothetical protein